MNWHNPDVQLPEKDDVVWVMIQHWKQNGPLSIEIYAGQVSIGNDGSCVVFNNDDIGMGSLMWYLSPKPDEYSDSYTERAVAWAYAGNHHIPPWIKSK